MRGSYSECHCIHAVDESTAFLSAFQQLPIPYLAVEPTEESIEEMLSYLKAIVPGSLVVFVGHGSSTGLYSAQTAVFARRTVINATVGNQLLAGKDVLLLNCKSADFIGKLTTYNKIIGFGNILSSLDEVVNEAEHTGQFRNLEELDIIHFNSVYSNAIIRSIGLIVTGDKFKFDDLPRLISFYIDKEINNILRQKEKQNRVELARLLFEFRNEMVYKKK